MPASPLQRALAQSIISSTNPIASPGAFDVFQVRVPSGATLRSPRCRIVECNGRESIVQEMQAPDFSGAILLVRGTHLVSVTYEIPIWDKAGFKQYEALIALLTAAQNARPQQSLVLTDLRLKNLRIPAVTPTIIPHMDTKSVGLWGFKVKFMENARLKIAGGPVQPPRNATEQAIIVQEAANQAKRAQLGDNIPTLAKAAGKL